MAVPFIDDADLVRLAGEVLAGHDAADAIPVDIESIIDLQYGINIYPRDGLMDRFQIDAFISRDLTEIVVDKRIYDQKPPVRYRFSLAHEFSHLILHQDVYRAMKFTTPQEWKRAMVELAENDYKRLEWQANTFAGLLLVPAEPLRSHALDLRQRLSDGGLDPDSLDRQAADRVLRMLGQAFQVSTHVMRIRLSNDRLWIIP